VIPRVRSKMPDSQPEVQNIVPTAAVSHTSIPPESLDTLRNLAEKDRTGVPKDLSKAYFWAILARANGDEASATRAAELASRISYSERNAIGQEADDWLIEHGSNPVSSVSK